MHTYYPLLKKNQLTCTAWVQSLNIRVDGRGKTQRSGQKRMNFCPMAAMC